MLKYWNDGQPLQAHVKGSGNKAKLKMSDGTVRMGKVGADESVDLYEFVESGPRPNKFEVKGSISLAKAGSTITATQSVVNKPLDIVKDILKADVSIKRDIVAEGGVEWSPDGGVTTHTIQTNRDSQTKLTGAVLRTDKNGNPNQTWRMLDNSVVALTKVKFDEMAVAVGDHVNACYTRQSVIEVLIDAAPDHSTAVGIDIEAGWPANPVEEV